MRLCFANGGWSVISALIKGINVKGVSFFGSLDIFERKLNLYSGRLRRLVIPITICAILFSCHQGLQHMLFNYDFSLPKLTCIVNNGLSLSPIKCMSSLFL